LAHRAVQLEEGLEEEIERVGTSAAHQNRNVLAITSAKKTKEGRSPRRWVRRTVIEGSLFGWR
jgi:hypothetical protein